MEYTTPIWSAVTTPRKIAVAGEKLNTAWGNLHKERVTGLMLGTACDKAMLIDIPVRPDHGVAVDYWLPLTRGLLEHQPQCEELRTRKIDPFPERLPYDYVYYFFEQELKKPQNKCLALSARQRMRPFYGDVVVIKRDAFNHVVDMDEADIRLVTSMATFLAIVE
ncbi:hypothetical protein BJ138DRAFT_1118098 [Hygrophoropsis aurantiaca]|uniref:Uncharacterized protein n=1 Tax=Hygrophoropsis aurantiaca TaxID=72124 RepID=A0ACB7ZY49_9AGAM|nr:hypothetical protein BJ138DRAFT_1118098 [Hygrophoropsis aurantiaca]